MAHDYRKGYQVYLHDKAGGQVLLLDDFLTLEIGIQENDVGALVIEVPERVLIKIGRILGIPSNQVVDRLNRWWLVVERRTARGWRLLFDTVWMIRHPLKSIKQARTYTLTAYSANVILKSRTVDYYAGSPQASKTGPADNMMKAVVAENFKTATITDRNLADTYFIVEPDRSLGPSIDKGFSNRVVFDVLQEIVKAALEHEDSPTKIWFWVYPVSTKPIKLEFRTYIGQRGTNRGQASGNTVEFSPNRGNLIDVEVDQDWTGEANAITVGGGGEGADRQYVRVEDALRSKDGPWGRWEEFIDSRNTSTPDINTDPLVDIDDPLVDEGLAALAAGNPPKQFKGTAIDSPFAYFQRDWDLGDIVVGRADLEAHDCHVLKVELKVSSAGEDIRAALTNLQ